ncbi:hypothetical protein FA95DRAFT_1568056 [Auriscalpium vulgare]|uniref:Uncharacterized protein n=1 Tax=Auriscalpium vulgare TaxID=40419 RepID=A0ACB8R1I0_9AGAM|nr:hypothetical protein FA95DRAFT_1568056 [Auriscalpium vulgare]
MYGRQPRLPQDHVYKSIRAPPTDEEIERLQRRRLEHVQDLGKVRREANERAAARLEAEAEKRDDEYGERAIGVGDQLQTRNGYILRNLYNGARLRRYLPNSASNGDLWFASDDLKQKDTKEKARKRQQNDT